MRKVRCYECGKSYDFDADDFCPGCGAFNQPGKSSRIGEDGAVVRVDGLNERGHRGSFVHQEVHAENRVRRAAGLEQSQRLRGTVQQNWRERRWKKEKKELNVSKVVTIVLFFVFVQLLSMVIKAFF